MHTWLHLGLGSFHRAHQAYYLNEYRKQVAQDWRLVGGNIRSDAESTVAGINAQHGTYTLKTVTPEGKAEYHTISSIEKCIPFTQDLSALIAAGADAKTAIISFTVTEAGYYLRPDLHLDLEQPLVAADIKGARNTIYAVMAAILDARKSAQAPAVTLLCCDNVRANGDKFHQGMCDFLKAVKRPDLIAFLQEKTTCPNTMVDRITPRPDPALVAEVLKECGITDQVPLMSESFIQWVIEDKFASVRPALEKVGVEFVTSVMPYEDAKLRILNASHSALAFAGALQGKNFVFECAQDESIAQIAYNYVTGNVIPCLKAKSSDGSYPLNLEDYRDTVLTRFKSPYIRDTLQRITQDSISKINTFILPTIKDCLEQGRDASATLKICACYFRFLQQWHQGKIAFEYQDSTFNPDEWHQLLTQSNAPELFARRHDLFGTLSTDSRFIAAMTAAITRLQL